MLFWKEVLISLHLSQETIFPEANYHPELTMTHFIHAYTNSPLKDVPIIIPSFG